MSDRHAHLFYHHVRPNRKVEKRPWRRAEGRGYNKSALVIVDEVGYTPIDREECNLFFRFIANRYEKASTIITSNKAFSDWTELFHDPVIVTAFLDRLLHHSVVINIKGNKLQASWKSRKGGNRNEPVMRVWVAHFKKTLPRLKGLYSSRGTMPCLSGRPLSII